jgi:NAD(P)-dependent dehydrogenase (short-subunit alcohol dehydrogenase family)
MSSVLVTGTSSGIGLATAIVLGRAGHTVYATMRNPERAPQLREMVAKEKLPVSILTMDVDSDESVAETASAVRSQAKFTGVLVNNTGAGRRGAIEELSWEDFRATMETNYFGALRCIRAFLPDMRERRSGCIINVTSVAGRIAWSPLAPYTASKFALEALSEVLGQETKAFNIRLPACLITRSAAALPVCSKRPSRIPRRRRWSRRRSARSLKVERGSSGIPWAPTRSPFCAGVSP